MCLLLRNFSAICFHDALTPFSWHCTPGFPQSYPQKLWVMRPGRTTQIKQPH
jgi:hypothetical protein